MDNECKNFLKNNGFGDVISELSDIGIKSLNELEGLSNEDIESKTSLKPLQAKKLYDMMQNPRHPKSPRASSSSSMTGFGSGVDNPLEKKADSAVELKDVASQEMQRSEDPDDSDAEDEEETGTFVQYEHVGPYAFGDSSVVTVTPQIPMSVRTKHAKIYGCCLKCLVKVGWKLAKEVNATGGDPSGTLPVAVPTIQFMENIGIPVCSMTNSLMGIIAKSCCLIDETPQILLSGFADKEAAESGAEPQATLIGTTQQSSCQKLLSTNLGLYDFHDKDGKLV